jgi:hypothetical protein
MDPTTVFLAIAVLTSAIFGNFATADEIAEGYRGERLLGRRQLQCRQRASSMPNKNSAPCSALSVHPPFQRRS